MLGFSATGQRLPISFIGQRAKGFSFPVSYVGEEPVWSDVPVDVNGSAPKDTTVTIKAGTDHSYQANTQNGRNILWAPSV